MVKIDVYSICWNEKVILPYFLRHYSKFARNITIYDNGSTDESLDIMNGFGVKIIPFYQNENWSFGTFNNIIRDIKNNCWKESDADWVIVCDIDEFLYHKDIISYFENTKSTHLIGRAFEMMSEELPTTSGQIYDELKMGYPIDEFISYNVYPNWKSNYSKALAFKPSEIKEIGYGPGAHYSNPIGNVITNVEKIPDEMIVKYPLIKDDLKMLHYKYLNRKYVINKQKTGRYEFNENEIHMQYDAWLPFCKQIID